MSPKRIVAISYLTFAFIIGYTLTHAVVLVFESLRVNNPHFFEVEEFSLASIISYGLAAAAAVVSWRHPKVSAVSFEVASELKKVTWPTWPEIRVSTIAVLVSSAVASLVLGGVYDVLASKVMTEWIPSALTWLSTRG